MVDLVPLPLPVLEVVEVVEVEEEEVNVAVVEYR